MAFTHKIGRISRKFLAVPVLISLALLGSACSMNPYLRYQDKETLIRSEKLPDTVNIPTSRDKRLAILLIDMQENFLKDIEQDELDREVPNQLRVLEYARRNKVPVYFVEYFGYSDYTNPKFRGTAPVLLDKIDPRKDHLIRKPFDDAFTGTNLEDLLRRDKTKYLWIMGVNASACVLETAYSARVYGYKTIITGDTIAEPKSKEWADYHKKKGTLPESADFFRSIGTYKGSHLEAIDFISQSE